MKAHNEHKHWLQRVTDYLDELSLHILELDEFYLKQISNNPALQRFSRLLILFTYFGDGYLWGLVGLYLILFGSLTDQRIVLIGLAIAIVDIAAFRIVKMIVERPRPMFALKRRKLKFRMVDAFAFPSGHATMAFGLSYLIVFFYPNLWAPAGAYLASFIIGLSRIFVMEHFPLDVLGGALLGTLLSILLTPLFSGIVF
ncbi:MAG: phosphatase PAP2 family protein [Candidatus Bipolaricaulota bacterium]